MADLDFLFMKMWKVSKSNLENDEGEITTWVLKKRKIKIWWLKFLNPSRKERKEGTDELYIFARAP